ncbi:MAG: DUF167 domain-containing protein [Dehalococcoidia bacterium]
MAAEVSLRVRVTPRSSRDEVVGWQEGVLRVRVQAAPVGGRANEALMRLLAEALGLARSALEVTRGHRGRDKTVRVVGLDERELKRRLAAAVNPRGRSQPAG